MPEINYANIERMIGGRNAVMLDKSDSDDTLLISLTHQQVALVMLGVILTDIMMPEFDRLTFDMTKKFMEVTEAQEFLTTRFSKDDPRVEHEDTTDHPGGD